MGKTVKTRSSSKKLDIGRTCKCQLHDDLLAAGENKTYRLHRKSSHDYNKQCMNWLIEKKYLSSTSTYFCSICLDYAKEKGSIATNAASKAEKAVTTKKVADKNDSVLKVVELIKNDKIKTDEMNLLCKTIGESIGKNISTRIQNDSPETHYKNLNDTMNKDCSSHLKTFDQNLLEFLTGIANINIENNANNLNHSKQKKIYACCLAAEQIYFIRNLNYIGGFYFSLINAFFVSSF